MAGINIATLIQKALKFGAEIRRLQDVRQNKGSILKASVEYIRKLKTDQCKKRILEEKVKQQDSQNRKLLLKLQVIYGTEIRFDA